MSKKACRTAISLLKPIKDQPKTITADNGKEFSQHKYAAQVLEIDWYFADPYSTWQRNTNENNSGLIRRYIIKGSDLKIYMDKYISEITQRLNQRPKKKFSFKIPSAVLG